MVSLAPLKSQSKWILLLFSFLLVAFGQPAWNETASLLAACSGFACFLRVLLDIPSARDRFLLAMAWYGGIQGIQLSWFLSHPFFYIYGVILFCMGLTGMQWGVIAIWIKPQAFRSVANLFALAGLWVLLEWSRLFVMTGLPFNPVGLTLTASLYPLQLASYGGVYGLSFIVMLSNLFLLRAWLFPPSWARWGAAISLILLPYLIGWELVAFHEKAFVEDQNQMNVLLVQPAVPLEDHEEGFQSAEERRSFLLNRWLRVLKTLKKQIGKEVDLIVFPELLFPFGIHYDIFPLKNVLDMFGELFGSLPVSSFQKIPYMHPYGDEKGEEWWVSNAYIVQLLSNIFDAHAVIGLEETLSQGEKERVSYSSAFHFKPNSDAPPRRYDKRVLVPMGEYIPFSWCRTLAARYGIAGSFTCGTSAQLFDGPVPFGASICYEEMYGHLMRESRGKGAELLVNLTNDGWFPNSRLPKQHFDHARLRTVENGIPLVRSCNTGLTGAVDSLGRVIGLLGEDPIQSQGLSDSLHLKVPLYHYETVYSQYGDLPVILFSAFALLVGLRRFFE